MGLRCGVTCFKIWVHVHVYSKTQICEIEGMGHVHKINHWINTHAMIGGCHQITHAKCSQLHACNWFKNELKKEKKLCTYRKGSVRYEDTCSVVICLSLNLFSTNLSTREVLPTAPSPRRTTLKFPDDDEFEAMTPDQVDARKEKYIKVLRASVYDW